MPKLAISKTIKGVTGRDWRIRCGKRTVGAARIRVQRDGVKAAWALAAGGSDSAILCSVDEAVRWVAHEVHKLPCER